MIKHLRKNPIALLALFLSLGGTSYAANTIVTPGPSTGSAPAYSSIWFVNHKLPELHVLQDKSSGMSAANVSIGAENTICLNGFAKPPKHIQVTSQELQLPAVQLAPTSGACAGKQARLSFYYHDGTPTIYGSFFVSVIS